ncbi:MAG: hypothetical protein AB7G06_04810 [Bdellovibrionales bacterium]
MSSSAQFDAVSARIRELSRRARRLSGADVINNAPVFSDEKGAYFESNRAEREALAPLEEKFIRTLRGSHGITQVIPQGVGLSRQVLIQPTNWATDVGNVARYWQFEESNRTYIQSLDGVTVRSPVGHLPVARIHAMDGALHMYCTDPVPALQKYAVLPTPLPEPKVPAFPHIYVVPAAA